MENTEQQIIDGLIISDGCVSKPGKNARISFTLKYRGFVDAIKQSLPSITWSPVNEYSYLDKRTGNRYRQILLKSRVHEYLTSQFDRWYKNGTKIVPTDLKIDSTLLLWWYLGDGHLHKKKNRPNYRRVCLSTDSFSNEDIDILLQKLAHTLGTDSSIYSESGRIMIGRGALCSLASMLISQNPVSEYSYKFDFGQYLDSNYLKHSYSKRPLAKINDYRKKHKVREFDLELLEV